MKDKHFGRNCAILTEYDLKILSCLIQLEKGDFLSKHNLAEKIGISYNKIESRINNLKKYKLLDYKHYMKGNVKRYKIYTPYSKLQLVQSIFEIFGNKNGGYNA